MMCWRSSSFGLSNYTSDVKTSIGVAALCRWVFSSYSFWMRRRIIFACYCMMLQPKQYCKSSEASYNSTRRWSVFSFKTNRSWKLIYTTQLHQSKFWHPKYSCSSRKKNSVSTSSSQSQRWIQVGLPRTKTRAKQHNASWKALFEHWSTTQRKRQSKA
jgi:hypothetical protein